MTVTPKAINLSDRIYITATQGRSTLVSGEVSGVSPVSEIVSYLKTTVEKINGIVVLTLRNCTQGWSQNHTLVLRRA